VSQLRQSVLTSSERIRRQFSHESVTLLTLQACALIRRQLNPARGEPKSRGLLRPGVRFPPAKGTLISHALPFPLWGALFDAYVQPGTSGTVLFAYHWDSSE
jgi:hypothetical protein